MQIQCDKCSAVSETVMPETYLEGDILARCGASTLHTSFSENLQKSIAIQSDFG